MSRAPARIAGWPTTGATRPGRPANLVLVDPDARGRSIRQRWPAAAAHPYAGMEMRGRVIATFLYGRPTVLDGKATL